MHRTYKQRNKMTYESMTENVILQGSEGSSQRNSYDCISAVYLYYSMFFQVIYEKCTYTS